MFLSNTLVKIYNIKKARLRKLIIKIVNRAEGGEFYSETLRKIFSKYHGVEIGMYTHGGCFNIGQFDKFTTVGRYCSIARTATTWNRNHPLHFKSTHAFFFNPALGYCKEEPVKYIPLSIGNDVWIGHNAVILPQAKSISDGAVIAAGAVVNKDIPPYAVVVGNPARIVRYRFSKETIEKLLSDRWWEKSIEKIKHDFSSFTINHEIQEMTNSTKHPS